jgi:hypothetical protein
MYSRNKQINKKQERAMPMHFSLHYDITTVLKKMYLVAIKKLAREGVVKTRKIKPRKEGTKVPEDTNKT